MYATEYWAEYFLAYVASLADGHADGSIMPSPIFDLALQLADQMGRQFQPSFATSTDGASMSVSSKTSIAPGLAMLSNQVQDERLYHLVALPQLHRCVVDYFNARSLHGLRTALDEEDANSDTPPGGDRKHREKKTEGQVYRDGITNLLASYQATLGTLLDLPDFPGISAADFQHFKNEFHNARYTCRLSTCPRATLGFDSAILRREHEQVHLRRFFNCTATDCHWPPFDSTAALRRHTKRYHSEDETPRKSIKAFRATKPASMPVPASYPPKMPYSNLSKFLRPGPLTLKLDEQRKATGLAQGAHYNHKPLAFGHKPFEANTNTD